MKKLLIIILLVPSVLYSQNFLEGVFLNDYCSECKEVYQFNKDGSFKYSFADDLGSIEFGEGSYILSDEELVLNFEEVKSKYFEKQKISEGLIILNSSSATDSVFYRAKIIDKEEKFPLEDALVTILDSMNKSIFPSDYFISSDELGFVEFYLPINVFPITLKFSYIGYNDLFFKPKYSINYNLICNMGDELPYSYTYIPKGSVKKFRYEENTDIGFYLKEKGTSRWFPFTKKK